MPLCDVSFLSRSFARSLLLFLQRLATSRHQESSKRSRFEVQRRRLWRERWTGRVRFVFSFERKKSPLSTLELFRTSILISALLDFLLAFRQIESDSLLFYFIIAGEKQTPNFEKIEKNELGLRLLLDLSHLSRKKMPLLSLSASSSIRPAAVPARSASSSGSRAKEAPVLLSRRCVLCDWN